MKIQVAIWGLILLSTAWALRQIPELQWTETSPGVFAGTLEYVVHTFPIPGGMMTTRAHRRAGDTTATIPSPLLRMRRGKTYHVTLKNLLLPTPKNPTMNILKDANITNIHTHGLHVYGDRFDLNSSVSADDIFSEVNGGESHLYVYALPSNHVGGTLWYHPHHHGSTFLQVASGCAGMIIVEDEGTIEGNTAIPWVGGMTEQILAFQYISPEETAGAGGDTVIQWTGEDEFWMVNGEHKPSINLPGNEWQRWRILQANFDPRPEEMDFPSFCTINILGYDGVWLNTVPRSVSSRRITITGASRVDIGIRCSSNQTGWITIDGHNVARVISGAAGNATRSPFTSSGTTWSPNYPVGHYLEDLRGKTVDVYRTVEVSATAINDIPFRGHHNYTFVMQYGTIEQWEVNGSGRHPFHAHIYHFQVQDVDGCDEWKYGDWIDVVSASRCNIRFKIVDFGGAHIMHCHILEHEDEGAMAVNFITGGLQCGDGVCNIGENANTCSDC